MCGPTRNGNFSLLREIENLSNGSNVHNKLFSFYLYAPPFVPIFISTVRSAIVCTISDFMYSMDFSSLIHRSLSIMWLQASSLCIQASFSQTYMCMSWWYKLSALILSLVSFDTSLVVPNGLVILIAVILELPLIESHENLRCTYAGSSKPDCLIGTWSSSLSFGVNLLLVKFEWKMSELFCSQSHFL